MPCALACGVVNYMSDDHAQHAGQGREALVNSKTQQKPAFVFHRRRRVCSSAHLQGVELGADVLLALHDTHNVLRAAGAADDLQRGRAMES